MSEKVVGDGTNVTSVPVLSVLPVTFNFPLGAPSAYSCSWIFPPL